MTTKIWGSKYWKLFHVITSKYPHNPNNMDKKIAKDFLNSIGYILPCDKCANHYRMNLKNFPIRDGLKSKTNFIKWFIDFHNIVNKSVGENEMTYDDAIAKIEEISKIKFSKLLNDVLFYTKHVIPEQGKLQMNKKIEIKKFIKAALYFGKVNIKFNFNFGGRKGFIQMHRRLINRMNKK